MSHLSPAEFVDLAEGVLEPHRAAHVEACDACRAQAAIVRDALQLTGASDDVPEPSPLFWDHLSARVREGIASEPRRWSWSFGWRGMQPDVVLIALAAAIFAVGLLTRDARRVVTPAPAAVDHGPVAGQAEQRREPVPDPNHAEVWAVLTAAAADLRLDEARDAGMAVPAAAIDSAVDGLTPDELTELGRLLQSELKRSSN